MKFSRVMIQLIFFKNTYNRVIYKILEIINKIHNYFKNLTLTIQMHNQLKLKQ